MIWCCVIPSLPICAQTLEFDQFVNGSHIGQLTAERLVRGEETIIRIHSKVETKLVFNIDVQFELESRFRRGLLESSLVRVYRNDKLKEETRTRREGGRYCVSKDGETTWLDHPGIRETSATIYFAEPRQTREVFSEQYGFFSSIRPETKGIYRLNSPAKKQDNRYHYRDEQLREVELGHWLANIALKIRPETTVSDVDK